MKMPLKVAVVGGGPAGLVTLKYLVEAHKFFPGVDIEAHLFEAHGDIGGVFYHKVYEDAEVCDTDCPVPSLSSSCSLVVSVSLKVEEAKGKVCETSWSPPSI